jgi:hypothetical protein
MGPSPITASKRWQRAWAAADLEQSVTAIEAQGPMEYALECGCTVCSHQAKDRRTLPAAFE